MPRTKKLPILAVFTWSLILLKIQHGGQDGDHCCDVTDLQQRHHPLNIPHFFEKINGFPLKAKSFRNTATYQKTLGRGTINPNPPLPPPPCITVGVWPCAYVREFKKKTHTTRKNTNTPTNWTIRTHTTNQKRTNNNGFRNTRKHPLFLSMFPFDTQIS